MTATGGIELTAFPAACGDCLVIEYPAAGTTHRILIDGGLGAQYEAGLGAFLTAPGESGEFDLVVVTHIDRDHIDGVISATAAGHLSSADTWFNGREEIDELINGSTRGIRQGDELSTLIPKDSRNRMFDGAAVHIQDGQPVRVELPGGAICTLLSPTPSRLERLLKKWPEPVADNAIEHLLDELDDPGERSLGGFGRDSSAANGSSIAFLLEVNGASLLLTGDAFANVLTESIKALLHESGASKLEVDLFKLSHHGSQNNMTEELLALIEPRAVLVCTDGSKYDHPDVYAMSKVREHYPGVPIHFTDDNPHIRGRAGDVDGLVPTSTPLRLSF